jgi:hypothetical protein
MPGFAERTLGDVLAALASDAASPGSGAAAAVAMAFAAACAGKALAISRRHRPPADHLQLAEQRLTGIVRRSLARADADAKLFEEFIHHRRTGAAAELIRADESSQALAIELSGTLDEITPAVHPVVEGDIAAARALLSAVNAIQKRITAENQREAANSPHRS